MLSKVNIWRFRVLDGAGKPVTTGDDGTTNTITLKGPPSLAELKRLAGILLASKRAEAMRAGLADPGYQVDEKSIEPLGHTDAEVGEWAPDGAKPLTLPTDAAVAADKEKHLAARLAE